jgi:hypothetical protein
MTKMQSLQAIRKRVRVSHDQRIEIDGLPFQPGSEVEVIVVEREERQRRVEGQDIYGYVERLKKKKGMPQYTLREIERIIHQSRGLSGSKGGV